MTDLIRGPVTVTEPLPSDEDGMTYEVAFRVALNDRAGRVFFDRFSDVLRPLTSPYVDLGETGRRVEDDLFEVTFRVPMLFFDQANPARLRAELNEVAVAARAEAASDEGSEQARIEAWMAGFKREGDDQ